MNEEYIVKLNLDNSNFTERIQSAAQKADALSQKLGGIKFDVPWLKNFDAITEKAKALTAVLKPLQGVKFGEGTDIWDSIKTQEKALSALEEQSKRLEAVTSVLKENSVEISGDTALADAVGEVAKSVEKLQKADFSAITAGIKKIVEALQGIGDINLEDVSIKLNTLSIMTEKAKAVQSAVGQATGAVGKTSPPKQEDPFQSLNLSSREANREVMALAQELLTLQDYMGRMKKNGVTLGEADYDFSISRMAEIKRVLDEYQKSLTQAKPAQKSFVDQLKELSGGAVSKAVTAFKALGKATTSIAGKVVTKGMGSLRGKIKEIASDTQQAIGKSNGLFSSLVDGFGKVLRFRVLSGIIKSITSGVGAGITNLYYANAQFAKSMDSVATSSQYLSNSIAAALAPAINALAPVLSFIVGRFVDFVNVINMALAAITGQSTWTKAVAAPARYADALGGAEKATKDADDAAKDYQKTLLGFDEINKLTEATDKSKSGSGSSGSSVPDYGAMFDTEELPLDSPWVTSLKRWADQIKSFVSSGEWEAVGATIVDGLGKATGVIYDAVTSGEFKEKMDAVSDAASRTLNGAFTELHDKGIANLIGATLGEIVARGLEFAHNLISKTNWEMLGVDIADGINGAVEALSTSKSSFGQVFSEFWSAKFAILLGIVEETDWKELSSLVAKNINDALSHFDWAKAGKALSIGSIGLLGGLATALEKTDWHMIAKSVEEFVSNIDFSGVVAALARGLGALTGGISAVVGEWIADGLSSAKSYFEREIEKAGGNIAEGILNGIGSGMMAIGGWCKSKILDPFLEGFKNAFGIHSPASNPDLLQAAGYVGEGILNGIAEPFKKIAAWVDTHILTPIKNAFSGDKGFSLDIAKSVLKPLEDGLNSFIKAFNKIPGINIPEINITGNLIDVKDKIPQDKKQVSAIAQFKEWGKGNTFKNTIPDMKAQFDSTSKGTSFSNTIKGMTASLEKKNELFSKTTGAMTANLSKKSEGFSKTTGAMTANLSKKSEGFSKTTGAMTANITKKKDSIPNDQKVLGGFTAKLNDIVSGISGIFGGKKAEGGLYSNGQWKPIQQFASGGYPSKSAQLFIAREAGPELVGTIGNRTAVVNNSQIVSSVAAGVAQSVYAVMKTLRNTVNVTVNTDTGAIARDMTDYLEKVVGDFKDVPAMMEKQLRESVRSATVGNPVYRPDDYHFRDAGSSSADYNRGETTLSRESVEAIAAAVSRAVGDKNVELKLDGKTIMRSTIRNIEDETIRTGRNPLLSYL